MLLLPIIVTWMSIEGHRRLVQVIPDPVHEWWDKWELRGLILLSLVSQIILTLLGNRRSYKPNKLTEALLWSAYLLADWVAAVAMGVISSNLGDYYYKGEHPKNVSPQLLPFWAPFFLMHLGGPDTITAYALEDNELWLRHFVGLLSQTALTVYIIVLSWKVNSRGNCKEMSDYMFYLLVKKRHMLPVGAGLITLQATVIEAVEYFECIKVVPQEDNLAETCRILLQHDIATAGDDKASEVQSASVLFHACKVAKELIAAENGHQMWEFVEELWVEIMCYASAQCRVDMHVQQLRRGPEFLSHVWLFQADLCLLDQFQLLGSISDNSAANTPGASV